MLKVGVNELSTTNERIDEQVVRLCLRCSTFSHRDSEDEIAGVLFRGECKNETGGARLLGEWEIMSIPCGLRLMASCSCETTICD